MRDPETLPDNPTLWHHGAMKRPLVVAVTPGCPAGIGPEVAARALVEVGVRRGVDVLFAGSPALLLIGAARAGIPAARIDDATVSLGRGAKKRRVPCAAADEEDPGARVVAGRPDDDALRSQRDALLRALDLARRGFVDAVCTAPVRKAALVVDGESFPGQTELCHRFLAADELPPLMCFAGGPFVLGLATVHVPIADVSASITHALVEQKVRRLADAARALGKRKGPPRIIVLGVNPHAGEHGLLGREDDDVVKPAIAGLAAQGVFVQGPVAADGFFADVARALRGKQGSSLPDAVLAMHHDQGLAPYKLLAGGLGVNVTWGLTVPRTSPDHGTADGLAGKKLASASSMTEALATAVRLATARA